LYIGKLIIDEAVRLVGLGLGFEALGDAYRSGQLNLLLWLLVLEFALAILSDLLGRMVSYADSLLSELFTNATSIRLMEHAATLDLEDFEDPDLQDKLDDLNKASNEDFDKTYADDQVDVHQAALNLMQRYAQDGDTAAIKAFAAATAPAVQEHLNHAEGLKNGFDKAD